MHGLVAVTMQIKFSHAAYVLEQVIGVPQPRQPVGFG